VLATQVDGLDAIGGEWVAWILGVRRVGIEELDGVSAASR